MSTFTLIAKKKSVFLLAFLKQGFICAFLQNELNIPFLAAQMQGFGLKWKHGTHSSSNINIEHLFLIFFILKNAEKRQMTFP